MEPGKQRDSDTGSFPQVDPMGCASSKAIFDSSLIPEVLSLCNRVIAREAADVELTGVRRKTLETLAGLGACGITVPKESGGLGLDVAVQREVAELLAGSDASTWFTWAQHHTPTRVAIEAGAKELAQKFARGELLAGVAFAHVRRPGPPNPVAVRVDGGWHISGTLDWVTGWDVVDRILIVIASPADDAYLHAYIEPTPAEGLEIGAPLALMAMGGTHTRPITMTEFFVPDDQVVALIDRTTWHGRDDVTTAQVSPAVFGLIRASIAELAALSMRRGDRLGSELSGAITVEATELRKRAYACTDVEENLQLRAASLALMEKATDAVINMSAGAAMLQGNVAGRRAREARFLMVQAQTQASRSAWTQAALNASP